MRRVRLWTIFVVGSAFRRTVADYATLTESVVLAAIVELALRWCSIATILGAIEAICPARGAELDRPAMERLGRFAAAPYRLFSRQPNCLRYSLVLCTMLRRRGASARLCIGVERHGDGLAAHAWVSVQGDRPDEGLSPFRELRREWSA